MIESINAWLGIVVGYVWSLPLVILFVGMGCFFTIALGVPQIKGAWHAVLVLLGKFDNPNDPGEISHFKALTTALSATVGLGNIAGVAVALSMGGPGAVFWMIVAGLLGMATKFTECTLGVMYRKIDSQGTVHGGPMHYIERGLGKPWRPLALAFAVMCIFASFGAANMFQANQVASIWQESFGVPPAVMGAVLMVLTAIVILGGIKRIASVTSVLVPFMAGTYVLGALYVILVNIERLPETVGMVLQGAFSGWAVAGGGTGFAIKTALLQGIRRGCFSNEAGMGSAAIAHSAAATKEPVREGVVALMEPFIDTVCICSMTALVILFSGVPFAGEGSLNGVKLTAAAFDTVLPGFGAYFIPIAVCLFAYSTLISWSYYGDRCVDFIFKNSTRALLGYRVLFSALVFVGAIWKLGPVLSFSDICIGLMTLPNALALFLLFPKLRAEANGYFARLKAGQIRPSEPPC